MPEPTSHAMHTTTKNQVKPNVFYDRTTVNTESKFQLQ